MRRGNGENSVKINHRGHREGTENTAKGFNHRERREGAEGTEGTEKYLFAGICIIRGNSWTRVSYSAFDRPLCEKNYF
jgi:hypothetical protein